MRRPRPLSLIKKLRRHPNVPGRPPGSVSESAATHPVKTSITKTLYSPSAVQRESVTSLDDIATIGRGQVAWINVIGLHDEEMLQMIAEKFQFHSLILEDIVNTDQRPKLDDYGDLLFVVMMRLSYDEKTGQIETEQISLVIGRRFVISFQERPDDAFEPIHKRLENPERKIRTSGSDYLAYVLLDTIVDHYFSVLEHIGESIEALESEIVEDPQKESQHAINALKQEGILLRRSVWPLRDVLSKLDRGGSRLIQNTTRAFLRDVYDHAYQVIETIETYRDVLSGLTDLYLSNVSNKMNEVMKVLTIIATIFIPLTFITGIYGMNFAFMPELETPWGYPLVMGFMFVVAVVMIMFFKRKRWL